MRSDWSGGHPPLRGTPSYPYGHPGYFNGTHAVSALGTRAGHCWRVRVRMHVRARKSRSGPCWTVCMCICICIFVVGSWYSSLVSW